MIEFQPYWRANSACSVLITYNTYLGDGTLVLYIGEEALTFRGTFINLKKGLRWS
jgi:hypothetical protein